MCVPTQLMYASLMCLATLALNNAVCANIIMTGDLLHAYLDLYSCITFPSKT